jgi:hypothetical protein
VTITVSTPDFDALAGCVVVQPANARIEMVNAETAEIFIFSNVPVDRQEIKAQE